MREGISFTPTASLRVLLLTETLRVAQLDKKDAVLPRNDAGTFMACGSTTHFKLPSAKGHKSETGVQEMPLK